MELFTENMKQIEKEKDRFKLKKGYNNHAASYCLVESKEDNPSILVTLDGQQLALHSLYYPTREAEKIAQNYESAKQVLVIMGLGLGYHVRALAQKFSDTEIYVVEPDKHLFHIVMQLFSLEEFQNVHYLIGWEDYEIKELIDKPLDSIDIFVFTQSTRIFPVYYEQVNKRLTNTPIYKMSDNWKYKKFQNEQVKVIFIDSAYVLTKECLFALEGLGHSVRYIHIDQEHYDYEQFIRKLLQEFATFKPDFVLTINHLGFDKEGRLTELLSSLEIPYVSWYVDSPNVILTSFQKNVSAFCNLFVWDKDYIRDLKQAGYTNIDYLPLGTSPEIFYPMPEVSSQIPVSFVGSSMVYAIHKNIKSFIHRPDLLSVFDSVVQRFLLSTDKHARKTVDSVCLNNQPLHFEDIDQRNDFEAAVLWRATQLYRLSGIKQLAPFYPCIRGDENWIRLLDESFQLGPEVWYYDNLCEFYNKSTISFNITSKQMKYAVNQRVFDVPACKQLIITDYKEQLEELFDIKEEIVFYREIEEISDLVRYYLQNEAARSRIVESAHRTVLSRHTYKQRLQNMIGIIKKRYQ